MFDTVEALREFPIAQIARVRLLSGVRSRVVLQRPDGRESHRTVFAGVRSFAGVDAPMLDQGAGRGEGGTAQVAHERMGARMGSHVRRQLRLGDEGVGAGGALECLDIRVTLQVLAEIGALAESFAANGAKERSFAVVRPNVIAQCAQHVKSFRAVRTLVLPLSDMVAHVQLQLVRAREVFGADRACVPCGEMRFKVQN